MSALRPKALAILRTGRLTLLHVSCEGSGAVKSVICRVTSSRLGGPTYVLDLAGGRWTCTCQGFGVANRCAHLLATQMVTGHAPLAEAVA